MPRPSSPDMSSLSTLPFVAPLATPGFAPGDVQHPEPGLRMILAPNPSPMTLWGTNTWLIGAGDVAVIDPGPADERHLAAILAALRPGERITHIFVTHAHLDHSPLARPLALATGAPVLAFGDARAGRSQRMQDIGEIGGGEGLDPEFAPDLQLSDGETTSGSDWELQAIHTPGHLGGHLCFAWGDRLFTGDHIMGWAPSLVSPPDGDMSDYMASLERIGRRNWTCGYSAHGAVIDDPGTRIAGLIAHRRGREASILAALEEPAGLDVLLLRVYADAPPALLPAAKRNLLAHLIDLVHRGLAVAEGAPLPEAIFTRT